jgi:flagellar secretion chaperone FliS
MNAMIRQRFLNQYAQTSVLTGIENATPHRMVQMLYDGVLDRIAQAKGLMLRKDFEKKSKTINNIIEIISHLQQSLDLDTGGEVAQNLYALYGYMLQQVFKASRHNDPALLDEVTSLMKNISQAWDGMPENFKKMNKEEIARLQS